MEMTTMDDSTPCRVDRRRARRFDIDQRVWLRTRHGHWQGARTVNISSRGVLIRGAVPLPPVGTRVRLRIPLPPERGWGHAYIASTGRIVRVGGDAPGVGLLGVEMSSSRLCSTARLRRKAERGGSRKGEEALMSRKLLTRVALVVAAPGIM